MKRIYLIFALCFLPVATGFAQNTHGAIYYNVNNGYLGYSYGYSSQWRANRAARKKCGFNCRPVVKFRNSCGALAVGRYYDNYGRLRRAYAGGYSNSLYRARSLARSACYRRGARGCVIRKSLCSWGLNTSKPRYYPPKPTRPQQYKRNKYAAIAYNPRSNRFAYAISQSSQWDANRKALRRCGYGSCRVAVKVRNACASLAVGTSRYDNYSKVYAGRWSTSSYNASTLARSACYRANGSYCRVVKTVCAR